RDHNDGEVHAPRTMTPHDVLADAIDLDRLLRDQDHVRAAGDPGMGGDPACVPAHHLADDYAVVRLGGGVEPVDGLGGNLDGCVEAEGQIGAGEIVVDGLRDADEVDSHLVQLGSHPERVLAADGHHRAHVE